MLYRSIGVAGTCIYLSLAVLCRGFQAPPSLFAKAELPAARHPSSLSGIAPNPLLDNIKLSKTIEVFSTVKEMEAGGMTITSLCVGEPDFPPPRAVLDATIAAVNNKDTRYTAVTGTAALRAAIANDLRERKGLEYKPTEVLVSNGAKQSVYQGVLAFCGEGDEVIIPAPYWPSYPEMVALTGAKPVIVPTSIEDGFLLDPEKLEGYITERTKLMIFCNPSNPTGAVHSEERQEAIAKVLKRHEKVVVLSDEIYERLVYNDKNPHVSFASIDGMYDRTLTVNGFSKAYAMTGMRLGYMAAPVGLIKVSKMSCEAVIYEVVPSNRSSCPSLLLTAALYHNTVAADLVRGEPEPSGWRSGAQGGRGK